VKPLLLTPGDPEGIGPEITIKALRILNAKERRYTPVVCIGAREPFQKFGVPLEMITPYDLAGLKHPDPKRRERRFS